MVNSMRDTTWINFLSGEGQVSVPYFVSGIIWSLSETNSSHLCKK